MLCKYINLNYIQVIGVTMKRTIVLEAQEDGGFSAYVPSLKGCISEGETKEEALKNIKEAIELYLKAN